MMKNKVSSEVSLIDVLRLHKDDIFSTMNCHAIGTIESFDPAEQTATIKISYKRKIFESGVEKLLDYPLLLDCPIISITGGQAGLTMPVTAGDSTLVLFNDRDIDNWFSGATSGQLASPRAHSISDGIALVGVRPLNKVIQNFDASNPTLFNQTTRIKVKPTKVLIENSTDKLGLVLSELIDTINAITTTNCVVGAPVAVSPASQAQLNLVKTKLIGLLE
jgi:hypothetical protein